MKELEKVYGAELFTSISDYETALDEYTQYSAASRKAQAEAERLERLESGMRSNLWAAEKNLKRELKTKGEGFTVVARSGRVYSEAILGSDAFPEPPRAVLQG